MAAPVGVDGGANVRPGHLYQDKIRYGGHICHKKSILNAVPHIPLAVVYQKQLWRVIKVCPSLFPHRLWHNDLCMHQRKLGPPLLFSPLGPPCIPMSPHQIFLEVIPGTEPNESRRDFLQRRTKIWAPFGYR